MPAPQPPTEPDPWLDRPSWAPAWLPDVDDVRSVRWLRWLVTAVFVAGLGACVLRGADSPPDPEIVDGPVTTDQAAGGAAGDDPTVPTSAAPAPVSDQVRSLADALGAVVVELVDTSGEIHVLCLLHADDAAERSQGLMGVTDLSGADGMLFSRPDPTTSGFYMYQTLLPLTVGWWDGRGAYVGQADMAPCDADDPGDCPLYPPPAPYVFGIEVPAGDPLAAVFPGSSIAVGSPCPL